MPADVLEQGPEQTAGPSRWRAVAVVLAGLAVVAAGALQGRGDERADGTGAPPEVLLGRAGVLSVRETPSGALHVRIGLEGAPRAQLASVAVDLPGSAVTLLPAPGRLTDAGTALLVVDLLPRCPDALAGLRRAAVRADVRARAGTPTRRARVALASAEELADAVSTRCGTVADLPELRTSPVRLDGPAGTPLRTRVHVAAAGREPVTVVAVSPGPGLATTVRTALPLVLLPGRAARSLRVDLRLEGCGGSRDTPPYLLVLSTGEAVATSVAPQAQPPLDALRPYQCAGGVLLRKGAALPAARR